MADGASEFERFAMSRSPSLNGTAAVSNSRLRAAELPISVAALVQIAP
jgi:hypothetical protein